MNIFEYTNPKNQASVTNKSTSYVFIEDKLCVYKETTKDNYYQVKCSPLNI